MNAQKYYSTCKTKNSKFQNWFRIVIWETTKSELEIEWSIIWGLIDSTFSNDFAHVHCKYTKDPKKTISFCESSLILTNFAHYSTKFFFFENWNDQSFLSLISGWPVFFINKFSSWICSSFLWLWAFEWFLYDFKIKMLIINIMDKIMFEWVQIWFEEFDCDTQSICNLFIAYNYISFTYNCDRCSHTDTQTPETTCICVMATDLFHPSTHGAILTQFVKCEYILKTRYVDRQS